MHVSGSSGWLCRAEGRECIVGIGIIEVPKPMDFQGEHSGIQLVSESRSIPRLF